MSNVIKRLGSTAVEFGSGYAAGHLVYKTDYIVDNPSNSNFETILTLLSAGALDGLITSSLGLPSIVETQTSYGNTISRLACAYHGYKRNNESIGYGIAWGLFTAGATGLGVACGQGYGQEIGTIPTSRRVEAVEVDLLEEV